MADLTLVPTSIKEQRKTATLVSEFENLTQQRRQVTALTPRRWRLEYRNQTAAERSTFDTFFASKGRHTSFTWVNPNDSTEYTVWFDQDDVEYVRRALHYDWDVTLREVI